MRMPIDVPAGGKSLVAESMRNPYWLLKGSSCAEGDSAEYQGSAGRKLSAGAHRLNGLSCGVPASVETLKLLDNTSWKLTYT